jgi:hypothetical protein
MSGSVLYMSMSLDGFITGPDDDVGQGLGRGGERLHDWLGDRGDGFPPSGPSGEIFDGPGVDDVRTPRPAAACGVDRERHVPQPAR